MAIVRDKDKLKDSIQDGIRALQEYRDFRVITEAEDYIADQLGVEPRTIRSWKTPREIPSTLDDGLLLGLAWIIVSESSLDVRWLVSLLRTTSVIVVDEPTPDWVRNSFRGARLRGNPPGESTIERVVLRIFPSSARRITRQAQVTDYRQVVDKSLLLLRDALRPYVLAALRNKYDQPATWARNVVPALADRSDVRSGNDYEQLSTLDALALLHVIDDFWSKVFHSLLEETARSFARELKNTRNIWAHQGTISGDDAYRTLDTVGRLLKPLGATDELETIEIMTDELLVRLAGVTDPAAPQDVLRKNLRDAPAAEIFYGRVDEFDNLQHYMLGERCRLLGIFGPGGIGKSTLTARAIRAVEGQFEYVLWLSLNSAPPAAQIVSECIQFFSRQRVSDPSGDIARQISKLVDCFQQSRCLLVLDNLETVLPYGNQLIPDAESYALLLRRIAEARHQSCVVLTSREAPQIFTVMESSSKAVRASRLSGIDQTAGQRILTDHGLMKDDEAWLYLIEHYAGSPLVLKVVASVILNTYDGDVKRFLAFGETVFEGVRGVLDQQFNRLAELEQEVMYWLAIEREPVTIDILRSSIVRRLPPGKLVEALAALQHRSLVERGTGGRFALQNVILEYVTERFVETVCGEFESGRLSLTLSHAFIRARAKDYIRESQVRVLLQPIADRLCDRLGKENLEIWLKEHLGALRGSTDGVQSFAAGNILNLLVALDSDLHGLDCSGLAVWGAYLQGVIAQDINFNHANLANSVFTDTFSSLLATAFSPDGTHVAASTSMGEIRIWRVKDGVQTISCQGHTDWVVDLAYSPDGRILASCSDDLTVRLWDASTGVLIRTIQPHTQLVTSIAFSPDGAILASSSEDGTISLQQVDGGEYLHILAGHQGGVNQIAYSPNGRMVASASDDQFIILWDVTTGEKLDTLPKYEDIVWSVAFSPDGKYLASGYENGCIRVWDVASAVMVSLLEGHTDSVWSIAFSPNGETLASASEDLTVRLWETQSWQPHSTLLGHTSTVWSIAFSPNGELLASASEDQSLRLWDVQRGRCVRQLNGFTDSLRSVAFGPNQLLAASGVDGDVRLWKVKEEQPESTESLAILHGHTRPVWSVAFSSDGRYLASGGDDSTARIWNVKLRQSIQTLQHIDTDWVSSVSFSPDSTQVACGYGDGSVRLWDTVGGQCFHILRGHNDWVRSISYSPDGSRIGSCGSDHKVCLWNITDGSLLATNHHATGLLCSLAFSPDGQTIATGSTDKSIVLWDAITLEPRRQILGHTNWVWGVAFNRDGSILVSASEDQTIRVWNVSTGACIQVLKGHQRVVWSLSFNPNGHLLASCSDDGAVKFWETDSWECVATLRNDRPYERMQIINTTGITDLQRLALIALGAASG